MESFRDADGDFQLMRNGQQEIVLLTGKSQLFTEGVPQPDKTKRSEK